MERQFTLSDCVITYAQWLEYTNNMRASLVELLHFCSKYLCELDREDAAKLSSEMDDELSAQVVSPERVEEFWIKFLALLPDEDKCYLLRTADKCGECKHNFDAREELLKRVGEELACNI